MKIVDCNLTPGLVKKILAAYLLTLVVTLLWPFDFLNQGLNNNVRWIGTSNGIEFYQKGQILSRSANGRFYRRLLEGNGFSLEVWVSAQNSVQSGPARIVSYSFSRGRRNFTLGQDRRDLIMRLRTTETDLNGVNPHLKVDDVFRIPDPLHIVVTYNLLEQNVYINGDRRVKRAIPGGKLTNWSPTHSLVLGNETTGDRPWLGRIFCVAIYNRVLDEDEIRENYLAGWLLLPSAGGEISRVSHGLVALYMFDEKKGRKIHDKSGSDTPLDLFFPLKIRTRPDMPFDLISLCQNPKFYFDSLFNILIFIPIGFLFHAALRVRYGSPLIVAGFVLLIGTLFTFGIESLQSLSPTRHSSPIDVLNNMLGTLIGVLLDKFLIVQQLVLKRRT